MDYSFFETSLDRFKDRVVIGGSEYLDQGLEELVELIVPHYFMAAFRILEKLKRAGGYYVSRLF